MPITEAAISKASIPTPTTRTFERLASENNRLDSIAGRLEYVINRIEGCSYGEAACCGGDVPYLPYGDEMVRLMGLTDRLSKLVENLEQHL